MATPKEQITQRAVKGIVVQEGKLNSPRWESTTDWADQVTTVEVVLETGVDDYLRDLASEYGVGGKLRMDVSLNEDGTIKAEAVAGHIDARVAEHPTVASHATRLDSIEVNYATKTYANAAAESVLAANPEFVSDLADNASLIQQIAEKPTVVQAAAAAVDAEPRVSANTAAIARVKGRHELALFDEFDRYANGPLHGQTPTIGPAWNVTGAAPIQVVNGVAITNTESGAGYAHATFAEPVHYIECTLVAYGTPNSGQMTIAWGSTDLQNLLHLNISHLGCALTVRQDGELPGGVFPAIGSRSWRQRIVADGTTRFRVGMMVRDDTVTVLGPNGEVFSFIDQRVSALASITNIFFEPMGQPTGNGVGMVACRAVRFPNTDDIPETLVSTLDLGLVGQMYGTNGTTVANVGTWYETTIGRHPTGARPAVVFGPSEIRTFLTSAASIGATTIVTDGPIPSGASLRIGGGNNAETVTTTGNPSPLPGSGYPFTHTLTSALTKAHPVDEVVIATSLPAQGSIEWNPFAPIKLHLGSAAMLDGKLYFTGNYDVYLERVAENTVGVGLDDAIRTGRAATGSRPSAATVGAGAQFYDTTLNKPIWSDGTSWRDASGTVV